MMSNMGFSSVWMMFFWLIVIVACVLMLEHLVVTTISSRSKDTPLDLLKKKYAEGLLTKEQFDEKKKDLL